MYISKNIHKLLKVNACTSSKDDYSLGIDKSTSKSIKTLKKIPNIEVFGKYFLYRSILSYLNLEK